MRKAAKILALVSLGSLLLSFLLGLMLRIQPDLLATASVGLLRVEGVITESEWLVEKIGEFRDDDRIRAVVLRLDSPGGVIAPTQEIYQELLRLREEKHLVASMGTVAASGGYYLACASDWIMANPGTLTGSVGVIMDFTTIDRLYEKIGLRNKVVKSGTFKDMGSPFRDMTSEEEALLQAMVDDTYDQFLEAVLEGRDLEEEDILPYLDGRIFSGRQALELGLVDEMGGLQDAIRKAAELGEIPSDKPDVIEASPRDEGEGLFGLVFGKSPTRLVEELTGLYRDGSPRALQLWRAKF